MPWDRGDANPLLVEWITGRGHGPGRAVVVGCGFGRDAEYLAGLGYDTVAFDISETAVRDAGARHPESTVDYRTGDLLNLAPELAGAFDFVLESHTVQSLPPALHAAATAGVRALVAPGGTLLVLAAAGNPGAPPWPLTREEIDAFADDGLIEVRIEQPPGVADPSAVRWRAEFRRS
ncbi:class I SAM-dependent methyltransferase [Amycolatopsis minnesotensis]|uniref:Methyltransferase domain-containing protein n=1 Tax=Amycolatopsis minnesotensis TaxID=337894 RepID=A0ABN2RPW8_9PSEU